MAAEPVGLGGPALRLPSATGTCLWGGRPLMSLCMATAACGACPGVSLPPLQPPPLGSAAPSPQGHLSPPLGPRLLIASRCLETRALLSPWTGRRRAGSTTILSKGRAGHTAWDQPGETFLMRRTRPSPHKAVAPCSWAGAAGSQGLGSGPQLAQSKTPPSVDKAPLVGPPERAVGPPQSQRPLPPGRLPAGFDPPADPAWAA